MDSSHFYRKLLEKANHQMQKDENTVIVIGPIFAGDKEKNLQVFEETILRLQSEGESVFSQIPFLDENLDNNPPFDYETKFAVFYKGLFESGNIKKVYVLPGWEESGGTKQEIAFVQEQGVEIEFL